MKGWHFAKHHTVQDATNTTTANLPDNQDSLVYLFGPLPQRVLALLFVHAALFGVPFWREVEVVCSRSSQCTHDGTAE